ncbi:hypothetical protein M413DRAFT_16557 [Hebeloma cylindrosporum]|uniref:Uncharacterized protein n=1 Tax=Hebeloma cylindrosporum TaxID=76867 RepID=A0A0C3CSR2_HEBCY|nr:hypothetical protein M413DRAFT_16557 [Hebeloma cylindrosporum h7]
MFDTDIVWKRIGYMGPLMGIVFIYLLCRYSASKFGAQAQKPPTPKTEKDPKFGTWKPVHFDYPTITPFPTDPMENKPIPYRPFRAGEYPVTMGIRAMDSDEWIEIDEEYLAYQRIRSHRIQTRGEEVIRVLHDNPGLVSSGAGASIELVHELAEYLSRRFPTMFEIVRHSSSVVSESTGWYGLPPIKSIRVLPVGKSYEIPMHLDDGENAAVRALEIASLMIQEDIVIMVEGTDGRYYFQAGAVLIAGFWRMQDKIGMPLDEIHNSGHVPRYKEKLQTGMGRLFQKLPVDKPVARHNYFFQAVKPPGEGVVSLDPEELAWSETLLGPEDNFKKAHSDQQETRPTYTPSHIRLRTERQTLRRLPRTGAIAFTIRTYLTPVEHLKHEPGVVRRLAGALRGWGQDISEYKGKDAGGGWWDVLMEYLDKCSDEKMQEDQAKLVAAEPQYPF